LVEHVQVVPLLGEAALDLGPALRSRGRVVGLRARLPRPRPARPHLVPLARTAHALLGVHPGERLQRGLLPDPPLRGLHELEHRDAPALVPAAQRQPERGGGLPLAVTGVHHEQRPVAALAGGEPVVGHDGRLSLGHQAALPVASATADVIDSALTSPTWVYSAPMRRARAAASPIRNRPVSESMTSAATPSRARWSAARRERSTAAGPAVARPSVTTTSRARRSGSRSRSRRSVSAASSRPSASGVRPPAGSSRRRAAATSTDPVGGSTRVASRSRKVTSPTRSRLR